VVAWRLGGRHHGVCEVVGERPGRSGRGCCGEPYPYRGAAGWVNGCGCNPADTVTLAHAPVVSVEDVRIAGVSLPDDAYVLIPPNRLVRCDGGAWPACQLLHQPDDADGVLVVDYTWGIETCIPFSYCHV
jgi:hypothetical protein